MSKTKLSDFSELNPKVAGIDIGNTAHYVTVSPYLVEDNVRKFSTFTRDLAALVAWLKSLGVESVAMESTGVYWMPLYELLEEKGFNILLVNARYPKHVSGRKSDVSDSAWIEQLHRYGLLPGSFIPPSESRELRHYVRQRNSLARNKEQHLKRISKALQQMNVKLRSVISKLESKVGLQVVRAIAEGETDAKSLGRFYTKQLKRSEEEFLDALQGNYRKEYLFSLKQSLAAYDFAITQMQECEAEIERILHLWQTGEVVEESTPFVSQKKKRQVRQNDYGFELEKYLKGILGIDLLRVKGFQEKTVLDIIAETGTDMSQWKDKKHFTSWLGLAPRPHVSGDKVIGHARSKNRGQAHQAFKLAAFSLHASNCGLGKLYRRLSARRGSAVAIQAVARKLAVIFYTMLRNKTEYDPLNEEQYEQKREVQRLKKLQKEAARLGFSLQELKH